MPTFRVAYTGDYLDAAGRVAYGDIGQDLLRAAPYVEHHFIKDHQPIAGAADHWDRLYSLEVRPEHIAGVHGLVIFRPWVKASAFAQGAADLVVIGRAGAGYDKIDL